MGASPQQAQIPDIQSSLDKALKKQKNLKQSIKQDARKARGRALDQLKKLKTATGTTLPKYISAVTEQFGAIPTVGATRDKYEQALSSFTPGLLGSPSDLGLQNYLTSMSSQYAQGVGQISDEIGNKFYKTLGAPKAMFEDLASSSAINLQRDPLSMTLATRPTTIRSDVESMKDLYDYSKTKFYDYKMEDDYDYNRIPYNYNV